MDRVGDVVFATALAVESKAKVSIQRSSGRYKLTVRRMIGPVRRGKAGRGIKHWSAPPGHPPNTDTGNLANSIRSKKITRYKSIVTCSVLYGLPLELGHHTKGGKFVAARPFMRPALESQRVNFQQRIAKVLK